MLVAVVVALPEREIGRQERKSKKERKKEKEGEEALMRFLNRVCVRLLIIYWIAVSAKEFSV